MSIVGSLFGIIWILLALASVALFVWALIDILNSQFADSTTKLIWIVIVLVAAFVGPLIWLLWGRHNQRI